MKFTIEDTYTDTEFSLDMVSDWAIYARAKDEMIADPTATENSAIRYAIEEEYFAYRNAMEKIALGEFDAIEAVRISDDDFIDIEDDFYTEEHMSEIEDALEDALKEAREDTYAEEVAYSWYNR